jgi:hypothetical protein
MLLREFGTEPLVRVMNEAEDAAHAQAVAQRLADWWQGTWRSEARQPWLLRRYRQNSAATGSGVYNMNSSRSVDLGPFVTYILVDTISATEDLLWADDTGEAPAGRCSPASDTSGARLCRDGLI